LRHKQKGFTRLESKPMGVGSHDFDVAPELCKRDAVVTQGYRRR
jgi:hypothetical protein